MKRNIKARIARAARIIRNGGVVIFPTETVYGIGADALNPRAVKKIFALKGRPSDNPLIVHIADMEQLSLIARRIPRDAEELMKQFWPGPLTLVFQKTKRIPNIVTAGLKTVAVRMPSHPIARALIRTAGVPIAAPSANVSGRPSATEAEHAHDDFRRKAPFILHAGRARFGVESTVFDMRGKRPVILREGAIPREAIERALKKRVAVLKHTSGRARSPGMKYRHYAPRVPVIPASDVLSVKRRLARRGYRVGVIRRAGSMASYARTLFSKMRRLEKSGVDYIVVQKVPRQGIGAAIMDRVRRAAQP